MRLELSRKPEGEWASFNEICTPPQGDGSNKEFRSPIPASEARSVLVMRGFFMMAPDNRLTVTNQKTGSIERDDPDGYKLETRGEDELWIVFDRAPAFEELVSVSGLGRKVGDAFKILPASTFMQQKIREKQPAIFRGPVKDRENVTQQDLQEGARTNFEFFVVDWVGVVDDQGAPLPCTPETKKAFLDQKDAQFFGLFVSNRAGAIRADQIQTHAKDSSDS